MNVSLTVNEKERGNSSFFKVKKEAKKPLLRMDFGRSCLE